MNITACLQPYFERVQAIESIPLPDNIYSLLTEAESDCPERIALHFIIDGRSLTYRELKTAVDLTAQGLAQLGVTRGTHVAMMLPNVVQWPVTWLALAKLAAVCIPINVRYTARELQFALLDAEAKHLVIDAQFASVIQACTECQTIGLIVVGEGLLAGTRWAELQRGRPADQCAASVATLDDLMNIQYTSGTTGLPKGCLLPQRYWLTCAKAHAGADGMEHKNILATNPFFYMTPQWLTLMAFFCRGTLFVATHRSGTHSMDWIRTYKIHFALFHKIIYDQPPCALDTHHELNKVAIYGYPKREHALLEKRFDMVAREAFGMTEIGSGLFMPPEAAFMTGSGSAGLAAPYRKCRVADQQGNTVPVNQPGELLFAGPGMLTGYYRRPEANATGFFGEWFRTGDLARQDEHGFIYIVGRIKDMVRRAGESIAATEVELVLTELAQIEEAAVVPVPDPLRGEEVKAYVRLASGVQPSDISYATILAHCQRNLAPFKVPRYLEYRLNDFPRTPSGKIRKSELIAEKADLRLNSWDQMTQAFIE